MLGERGRKMGRALVALVYGAALGVGCNVLFGINEYSDESLPAAGGSGGTVASNGGSAGSGAGAQGGASGSTSSAGAEAPGGAGGSGGGCMPGETMSCYDGPAGTEGIGACKAGSKTCNQNGDGFGPCDAVVPAVEECGTVVHESCKEDIAADCGKHIWSRQAGAGGGDASDQVANGVIVDTNGDVFVVGTFSGQLNFGQECGALNAQGNAAFIAKLHGASGTCAWLRMFDGGSDQTGNAVAVGNGNVYITGTLVGSAELVSNAGMCSLTSAGAEDAYVAKLNATDGDCIWAKALGDSDKQKGNSIGVDASGNVFAIGDYAGTIAMPNCFAISTTGTNDQDIFVVKLDEAGQCLWSFSLGDDSLQHGDDIAVDGDAVALTGGFLGNLASTVCPSIGSSQNGLGDIFVTRATTAGTCNWSKSYGDLMSQTGRTLALDVFGNTYVAGTMAGAAIFDSNELSAMGTQLFLAKIDANAVGIQSRVTTGNGIPFVSDLAVGAGPDQLFLTGYFNTNLDLGSGLLISGGAHDVFLARFTSDVTPLWSKRFGGMSNQSNQRATGVAVDSSGDVVIVGFFEDSINLGGDTLISTGGNDVFVAKLSN